jgi:hypothetical protein
MAQNAALPVQPESLAPSLTIIFNGQQGGSYQFRVWNKSGHAVTAFALRLVPSGIQKVDGRYACDDRCSLKATVADNAQPAIKAGESMERSFDVSSLVGGALVAEAAVFDDESYQGEDRAAAFLVAGQIGKQAEYDRLIAAVGPIIGSGADDDARRTAQLRMKLAALSVNLDPAMVRTFRLWFPALADCVERYARLMKRAAAGEKRLVVNSLEHFAHGTAPGQPSLTQWWATTQSQLAASGCQGCAAQAMHPKPPSAAHDAALGCPTENVPLIFFTASLAGDDELDAEDAEGELEPEDVAAAAEGAPVRDVKPAAPSPAARAATPAPTPAPTRNDAPSEPSIEPKKPSLSLPPSGMPYKPAPDGKGWLLSRMTFGLALDSHVYRAFFRDLGTLGDMALQEVVRWDNGMQVENHGPRAGGLNKAEIVVLNQVSAECNRQLVELNTKLNSLLVTNLRGYPVGWMVYAPPMPAYIELRKQERAVLDGGIAQLRTKLGPESFFRLDRFVHQVYQATPARIKTLPLADDLIYAHFLRYFSGLAELAATNPGAKDEAARRQKELRAAGLGENERALLARVALDYRQISAKQEAAMSGRAAIGAPQTAQTMGPPSPGRLAMPAQPATSILTPKAVRPPESQRGMDELRLGLLTDIAQLQAGMSKPVFRKFDDYLHKLYAPAAFESPVAISAVTARESK